MKKILKYTLRILAALLLLTCAAVGLLYVPGVLDFACRKAAGPLSRTLGMELTVGRLRLGFPLRLTAEEIRLVNGADTLVDCGRVGVEVDPWPLVRREAVVRKFGIDRLKVHYRDTATGFEMRIKTAGLKIAPICARLREEEVRIGRIRLDGTSVGLRTGATESIEEPDTSARPGWRITVEELAIHDTQFGMTSAADNSELAVDLSEGIAGECRIALDSQQVNVASLILTRGNYLYLTASEPSGSTANESQSAAGAPDSLHSGTKAADKTAAGETENEASAADTSLPWSVRVGTLAMNDNQLTYGKAGHRPAAGFDPLGIRLTELQLEADSLYNRGSDVALQLRQLAFAERCGVRVEQTRGRFSMDAAGIDLDGFELATADSRITARVKAGSGILQLKPTTPLTADMQADVAGSDARKLFPTLPAALRNRRIGVDLTADGTLEDLNPIGLRISSPGHLQLDVNGRARQLLTPERLTASARFRGDLRRGAFLVQLLPDTTLRQRVTLPRRISLEGSASASAGNYTLTTVLTAGADRTDAGRLAVDGRYETRPQRYEASIRCDSFPVGSFLPKDSLGRLDLRLLARGRGFDPYDAATQGSVRLEVDRAEYAGHDFGGLGLEADLTDQQLTGRIEDRDSALRLALGIEGRLTPERQQARLAGRVGWFDLAALGLVREPIGGLFDLEAEASATREKSYAARIALDSIRIRNSTGTDWIRPTSLSFETDTAATKAELQSGDLRLAFFSPAALDTLRSALPRTIEELNRQIRAQRLDMDSLKPRLPDFGLQLTAGPNNILNNYLRTQRAAFRRLEMRGANCDTLPLALGLRVEGLTTGGIRLDTVGVSLRQQGARLHYALRMANAPGNLDRVAAAGLYGDAGGNTASINLYQRDRSGQEGLRSRIDAMWNDSLVRLSLGPDPQFGFEPWTVNPGNYLVYRFDRRLAADLDLTRGEQRFALHTLPEENPLEGIRLGMAGLGIGSMLELLPSAPPVDGRLGADLALELGLDTLALQGEISIGELTYDRQRFGDLALKARYRQGAAQQAEARMTLDTLEILAAQASYDKQSENPLDARLEIPGLPLQRLNVFLPEEMLRLSGMLTARILASGSTERPRLDGALRLAGTELRVPMIGTSFRMAEDTIRIDQSRIGFDRYAILAPNRQPLTIDGAVDLTDPQRMTADLRLKAADFQFVNVPRKERTTVYGQAYLDLNTSVRGPVDALVVRGNVALLGGTEINYVMQSSPLEVKQQSQNVVQFVSFAEIDNREAFEELPPLRIGGMDIALNVDINNDVKAAVDLSTDGSNRIDLRGGGNLSYTMNPLGDTRLSGRYLLTGGTVRYSPPIIAQKVFTIRPGGYVEWLGDVADPSFNITAVESVRANVSSDGEDVRPVNFDIAIHIRNSLNDLEVSFDLSAPEDLTMQNQLNSLTAEQRANQAMNLLIYNTYTGPGTSARVSAENPLNTFIQKELNQWAQNNLKGVDLSFGIDSYGQDDPNGQRTDYSYRLSKNLFSNRIRAVIGGKFSTDADPTQNLKENLIDDISIEYMLDKRDNMYIKVFRHTGYESILEGEITETGVGFVIRKRLSRLGDLFRSSKPRTQKTEQP